MIIVKLTGGLGNQMFQYAAGCRLAQRHDVRLKLDLSNFAATAPGDTPRNYALNVFQLEPHLAEQQEIADLCRPAVKLATKLAEKILPLGMRTYYKERQFNFDPDFIRLGSNVCLEGFWQSEKYFSDISETIQQDFALRQQLEGRNLELSVQIRSTESVSIHVRRGDYVSNPSTGSYHGICPLIYYRLAVEYIAQKKNNINLFIFSDDPAWVRGNLQLHYPTTLVDHNGESNACEDLRLMSLCRYNIIANSSFSWWGAWLNRNPGKLVVAPANWFKQQNIDTSDLIPTDWHRI